MKKYDRYIPVLIIIFLLGACNQAVQNQPTLQPSARVVDAPTTPPRPTTTPTLQNTATHETVPTDEPDKTATSTPTHAPVEVSYIGTDLPQSEQVISTENLHNLTQVGQWGYGRIIHSAFTPDGSQFIISSALGFAIYDMDNLDNPPEWVAFKHRMNHDRFEISSNGKYLRFTNRDNKSGTIIAFPDGTISDSRAVSSWEPSNAFSEYSGVLETLSNHGDMYLKTNLDYDEDNMEIEYSIREVFDADDMLLYTLSDETSYIKFFETYDPSGCDLHTVGACGNGFADVAYKPAQAAFAPDDRTLAILYVAGYATHYNPYRMLRIYNAQNGALLSTIGNEEHAVQTFTYSPDSQYLIIGYYDGTVERWNIASGKVEWRGWQFTDILDYAEFTQDSRYVLVKRGNTLEIRTATDGSIRSRLEIGTYLLSPIDDNRIIFSTLDHYIKYMELDSGEIVKRIPAHDAKILALAISSDGKYLASSAQDCKIKLWDAQTGEFLHLFEETWADAFAEQAPSPDYETANYNSRIFIFNMKFIENTHELFGFGSYMTNVNWDVNSGASNYVLYTSVPFTYHSGMTLLPHFPERYEVMTPQGKLIFSANKLFYSSEVDYLSDPNLTFDYFNSSEESFIHISSPEDDTIACRIQPGKKDEITGFAVSPDGKQLLVASDIGTIHIYQIVE